MGLALALSVALLWVSVLSGGQSGLGLACSHAVSPGRSPWQREVDRNQELLTRIRQLQEREAEAEGKMKEQLQRYRVCQQSLDAASKRLRDQEDGLAEAGEVRGWGPGLGCCPLPASSLGGEETSSHLGHGSSVVVPLCTSASHVCAYVFCVVVIVAKILIFHSVVFS